MKKYLAILLSLFVVSCGEPAPKDTSNPNIQESDVVNVVCNPRAGSGFMVDKNTLVTAHHVSRDALCSVKEHDSRYENLLKTKLEKSDASLDLSQYAVRGSHGYDVNPVFCGGMTAGNVYWLAGYPGNKYLRIIPVIATSRKMHGQPVNASTGIIRDLRIVEGKALSGMSGGPVFNQNGEVVAVITATSNDEPNTTLVRELKDTWVCGK